MKQSKFTTEVRSSELDYVLEVGDDLPLVEVHDEVLNDNLWSSMTI